MHFFLKEYAGGNNVDICIIFYFALEETIKNKETGSNTGVAPTKCQAITVTSDDIEL